MKWCVIIFALFITACSSYKKGKEPIEIDRMKLVVWDMIKAGEWHYQRTLADTMLKNAREDVRLYAQVFSIHGITRNDFFDSYKYYEAHPAEFKILLDSVEAFANREKNAPVDTVKKAAK